ncbi:hypothetical protein ACTXG7_03700 [Mycolicibacterium sp. Dal123E01]
MTTALEEDILRYRVPDDELEAAAEEVALAYTYQTRSANRCCN